MKDFSYITNSSPAFIENLYREFIKDPDSVDPEMKKFFEGFDFAINNALPNGNGKTVSTSAVVEVPADKPAQISTPPAEGLDWMREIKAYRLILGYRNK